MTSTKDKVAKNKKKNAENVAEIRNLQTRQRVGLTAFDRLIKEIKKFWWKWTLFVVASSIIALFVASLVMKDNITVDTMNSWVGTILGLVALVISIISMVLSFYNLDSSIRTQEKTLQRIDRMTFKIITKVEKSAEQTQAAINGKVPRRLDESFYVCHERNDG